MGYKIITGEDFGENYDAYLDRIYKLDQRNYIEEYWGERSNMTIRYLLERKSFVCVVDEDMEGESDAQKIIAYMNFFPVAPQLWEDIVEESMELRDDDIGTKQLVKNVPAGASWILEHNENIKASEEAELIDVVSYVHRRDDNDKLTLEQHRKAEQIEKNREWDEDYICEKDLSDDEDEGEIPEDRLNRLFILSVVVDKDVRANKDIRWELSKGFIVYINKLEDDGFPIDAISATAVTVGGRRFLRDHFFGIRREIEDGDLVFVCEGDPLEKMKSGDLYKKTFKDDVYLFLPFAENKNNPGTEKLFESEFYFEDGEIPEDFDGMPEVEKILLNATNSCMQYECRNDVVKDMRNIYIGQYMFMHTLDNYPAEPDDTPHVVGEETVYMSIMAHRPSHMYVLMMFIPNSKYSPSMIEDQLSHGFLKIRKRDYDEKTMSFDQDIDEKGHYEYRDLFEFMKEEYGLIDCGTGKTVLCMSNVPTVPGEMYNILTGEVYTSLYQSFHINYEDLDKLSKDNRAIYDYYEVYIAEKAVAFIPFEFAKMNLKERIEQMATYLFIVQLIMFQNTALNKMSIKVTNALAQEGDVSYQYIKELYADYAKTIKFWQSDSFVYMGTQQEAKQIQAAFGNEELRQNYNEQQEFLERIIALKDAEDDKTNNLVVNMAATFLALLQVQSFFTDGLDSLYSKFNISLVNRSSDSTFTILMLSGIATIVLIMFVLRKRDKYYRVKRLREYLSNRNDDEQEEGGQEDE